METFPRYWPFVRGIHRSPVNSPHKCQRRGGLMFSLICAWTKGWVNIRYAGDVRRHLAHDDVIVMWWWAFRINLSSPGQNDRHFAGDIFKYIFANEMFCIFIRISLKFVPKGPIDNNLTLFFLMAWRRIGDKSLSESMLTEFTDACMRH